jgi:hypothetical protein
MMRMVTRLRAALADQPSVQLCDSCGSVSVCDTSCRAAAARDRAVGACLTLAGPVR